LADNKKKKISIVAHDLSGGGMTRAYVIAQALLYAGFDAEILGVRLGEGAIYPVPPPGVPVKEVDARGMAGRLDGDIVYAIKPRPTSYGIALLWKMKKRRPVILDIDDWELGLMRSAGNASQPDRMQPGNQARRFVNAMRARVRGVLDYRRWMNPADKRYIRWIEKTTAWADEITVDTRFLQQRYGGTCIPHCKDTVVFDPGKYDAVHSRASLGLSGYVVLMFPGTARAHKGLEDVLEALEILQRPDVRLALVGGRSSGNEYTDTLLERWGQWIVRLPQFAFDKMPEVVSAAHIVVVPQRDTIVARAQFPMKLTDAMAMAKPILSTSVGDIPEILGDAGYIVEPSRPEQLAKALKFLIENPVVAERFGTAARARCIRCYSLPVIGSKLSGIIERLK
jgi:glycosyltransferase involved in cell wall biosynthesis